MKITVLGSGSTGNAVLICTEKTKVLIDAGMSAKQILLRLAAMGEDCERLDAILITHEHSDHAGGLRVFLKSVNVRFSFPRSPKTRITEREREFRTATAKR